MLRQHIRRPATALLVTVCVACSSTAARRDAADVSSTPPQAEPNGSPTSTVALDPGATPTSAAPSDSVSSAGVGPPARLAALLSGPIDVAAVASLLSTSSATIRDTSLPDAARAAAGAELQLALRWLAERPELDNDVVELLEPPAIRAIQRMIEARQFAAAIRAGRASPAPPAEDLPAWTIVEAEPMETLLGYYAEAEEATGVAWYWLAAIHVQETRAGRIVGVSSAGAIGPMQFLPSTWDQCCIGDPTVTRDAILGAATYLAQSGAPQDMRAAVYQYNPNVSYVVAVTATAENLREAPELFAGYYGWQVFFSSAAGDVRLPVGYSRAAPISALDHVRDNPDDLGD